VTVIGDGPRAGDLALAWNAARDGWLPAGRVERRLPSKQSDRLLIERAFGRGTYLVARAANVVDVVPLEPVEGAAGARWLHLSDTLAALYAGGVFARATGYLTKLPYIPAPPPPPDDARALAALEAALRDDPITAGGDLSLTVTHGVALLGGWTPDVGAKVHAERLARKTPGVWEAINSLLSDEELGALVRQRLLEDAGARSSVLSVSCQLGRVRVALAAGGASYAGRIKTMLETVSRVRAVAIEIERGAGGEG
jgi:hypothetical protein